MHRRVQADVLHFYKEWSFNTKLKNTKGKASWSKDSSASSNGILNISYMHVWVLTDWVTFWCIYVWDNNKQNGYIYFATVGKKKIRKKITLTNFMAFSTIIWVGS